jgi:hypothetical protein
VGDEYEIGMTTERRHRLDRELVLPDMRDLVDDVVF